MDRKKYDGKINNKDRSKEKLINAVGKVLKKKGYVGLTATNIAKEANLSRRLITTYFDSVNHLIETYVKSKDYWVEASGEIGKIIIENGGDSSKNIIKYLLENQLDFFYNNSEMQKLILWEISQKSKIMYEVCEDRERLGSKIFELIDKDLQDSDIDIRAISALLVAGIYYMVLHAKSNDTTFCEIDINQTEGYNRIRNALNFIIENTYNYKKS
ncbi:TetR/AcrR family transcriptional regulator [Polaribacter cellanae]|uniref:TetR/AcrR family transcriptional regulator n=1 Tax=Polaribacter cellanae TaxID=2818493 RepID=A0A975H7K0_9FLAO|nr:TetR/AcrR family transcriptional regulator [Polaribacter cellanae]QTE23552.1 TetR/AcrR family transcriptional regulator [Polaribacter cellanae]